MSTVKLLICSLVAVVFTWVLHEFTHWTIGNFLGYEMQMTLNKAYPLGGIFNPEWHYHFVSAVGPTITLLQSVVCYFLIVRYTCKPLFPFLFTSFYLEFLSGVMNLSQPNDLGRVGLYLNIGLFTLPVLITAIHLFLLVKTVKREGYKRRFVWLTILFVLFFSSLWILINQKYSIVLL